MCRPACLLLVVLLGRTAVAQTLEPNQASAAELALAGAAVAARPAPAALWVNPANLVGARSRVAAALGIQSSTRAMTRIGERLNQPSPEVRDAERATVVPAVALTIPLWRERLWLALAYRQRQRVDSRYFATEPAFVPEDAVRYMGQELRLHDHRVAAAVAVRWWRLRLGAALEIGVVRLRHVRALWAGVAADALQDLENPDHDVPARLDLAGVGLAGRLGIGIDIAPWLRLAAALWIPAPSELSGDLTLEPSKAPPTDHTLELVDGTAELALGQPLELTAGLGVRPWSRLWLLMAVGWQRWSAADRPTATVEGAELILAPEQGSPQRFALEQLELGIGLRDVISFHAGTELVVVKDFLSVRVGWSWHRGASDPELPSPVALDLDRHQLGLGLQASVDWLTVALGVRTCVADELTTDATEVRQINPLDPELADNAIGAGRYRVGATRALLEVQIGW